MRFRRRLPSATALALSALVLLSPPPHGQETDEHDGEFTLGAQYYADSDNPGSAKFEEYRDVPNGFVAERFAFSWRPRDQWVFDVDAYDVSQRDQRLLVGFGKADVWRGEIRWVENRRQWTDQAFQLHADQGSGIFTLIDSFQAAVQAETDPNTDGNGDNVWDDGKGAIVQNAVASGSQAVLVGHQRRTGGIGFTFTPDRSFTAWIGADRERRSGTTPQTLGMYFSLAPAEVAAPYDFKTDWARAGVEYASRRYNVGAEVTASTFDTGFKSLTWDNQLFLADTAVNANVANPGRGRLTLGTDNTWGRISVSGGVNLPARTRLDASLALVVASQDDPFLAMTTNSLLASAALPAARFNGEHRTSVGQIRISSRPLAEFRWSAWARSFEIENDSPSLVFADYVQTDYQFPLCGNVNACDANGNGLPDDRIARRSLPYGFERRSAGATLGFSPVRWFDGSLTFERETLERTFSAVEESDEDIWKLVLDFDAGDTVGIRTTLRRQERRTDHYDAHYFEESFPIGEPYVAAFNEGARRFTWTDRDRDAMSLLVDWTPQESVSIYAEASYADDDYTDPETGQAIGTSFSVSEDRDFDGSPETYDILLAGRTRDRSTAETLGVAWTPTRRLHLSADHTWEKWEYGLETRYRGVSGGIGTDNPLDNWGSDTVDEHGTASLGLDLHLTEDARWQLRLDASRSKGTGDIETHFVPGGAASGDTTLARFPELATTLTLATASLTHQVRSNLDYQLRFWYESWEEDNFASDFNEPYMGAPNQDPSQAQSVFLGLDFKNYTNSVVSLMLRCRF